MLFKRFICMLLLLATLALCMAGALGAEKDAAAGTENEAASLPLTPPLSDTPGTVRELLEPIFKNGELVYDVPDIAATRAYCADCVAHLWEEVKRFDNPHTYYVDLSQKLYDIKQEMLASSARGEH